MKIARTLHPSDSLLEQLRRRELEVDLNGMGEETRSVMDLIVDHRSEFPQTVQTIINRFSSAPPSIFFFWEVYNASRRLLLGRRERTEFNDENDALIPEGWHGLDDDVDTEDQVELVIRLFPSILKAQFQDASPRCVLNHCLPIQMLLTHAKAVSFVPLFCKLGSELGCFDRNERGGLRCEDDSCHFANLPKHLLANEIAGGSFGESHTSPELDDASLQTLIRLHDSGAVTLMDISDGDLLWWLLRKAANTRTSAFVERRIQLLVDWEACLLESCELELGNETDLLSVYAKKSRAAGFKPQTFAVIFKLGVQHFPLDLGFLFHGRTFELACEKLGADEVAAMVQQHMLGHLHGKGIVDVNTMKMCTLEVLVSAAATNDKISVDGVYTLVRHDPMALLQKLPENGQKRKRG